MDQEPIKILVVDDDQGHAGVIAARLQSEKEQRFDVETVFTLTHAMEYLCQNKVHLILLDLTLPECQGIDTVEKIRSCVPRVPIVALTGIDDEAVAIEALKRGAEDYAVKGTLPGKMLSRIILYAIERNRIKQDLDAANKRLEQMTLVDPLTEVLNRRGLQEALVRETMMLRRYGAPLIAMLIDLDNFKEINDSLGHNVGDIVLKEVARVMKEKLRFTDHTSRIGGDEFLVLMSNTRIGEGLRVAERLRLAIAGTLVAIDTGEKVKVTASFGVVQITDTDFSIDQLLAQTHRVLKKSKQMGKDLVTYSDGQTALQIEKDKKLLAFIDVAAKVSSFKALKHPIFALAEERLVGYEFLSRMKFPIFEMPEDFFRLGREAKILTLVDHQCFRSCLRASTKVPKEIICYLNLLPSTLIDISTSDLLEDFPTGRPKTSYCIELSEKQVIGNPSYLVEPIRALKKEGVLIALDDVGFGQSCLESLIILEPHIVKIDRSWINGMTKNRFLFNQVERLLKVTESLEMDTVAEGIETREDLESLKKLNVKYGQGYLWGKPA